MFSWEILGPGHLTCIAPQWHLAIEMTYETSMRTNDWGLSTVTVTCVFVLCIHIWPHPLLFVNPIFWIHNCRSMTVALWFIHPSIHQFCMTASPIQSTHRARALRMSWGRSPFYNMNNTYAANPSHLWKIPRSPSHLICMHRDCGRQHEHPEHGDNMEKSPQKLRPKSAGRFCEMTVLVTYAPCPFGIIHIIHI